MSVGRYIATSNVVSRFSGWKRGICAFDSESVLRRDTCSVIRELNLSRHASTELSQCSKAYRAWVLNAVMLIQQKVKLGNAHVLCKHLKFSNSGRNNRINSGKNELSTNDFPV